MSDRCDADLVVLSDRERLARGAVRDVYDRPGRPGEILKTMRSRKRAAYGPGAGLGRWLGRMLGLGPYRSFLREYETYLRTGYRADKLGRPIPIAPFGALVRTDEGLALVCAKIADEHGALAPTLRRLMRDGRMDPAMVERLNAFVADVYALGVNVPDMNGTNIVYDPHAMRFVLVDGYGDKTLIPVRRWIPALNRRMIDRRFANMSDPPAMRWDPRRRRYVADAAG